MEDCHLQPDEYPQSQDIQHIYQEPPHPQLDTEVIAPQEQDASPEDAPLETRHTKKRRAAKLSTAQLLQVPLSHVLPRQGRPRRTFDPAGLAELTASIKTSGVLEPILVCPLTQEQLAEAQEADRLSGQTLSANALYQIVAGERRWRASMAAGLAQIPILLDKNISDDTAAEIALVGNLQREDLPPLDTADAMAQLQHQGYSLRKLAVRLGKNRGWIEQYLALARMPGDLRELVSGRPDTLTHVRELKKVADPALRAELIARVTDKENPLTLASLRRRIHQSEAKDTSAEADAAPTTGELEIAGDPATAGEIAAEACQENLPSEEQDDQSAEEDTADDCDAEAADDCDAEAPGDLDFLEDEHSGLDYSAQAALDQNAVSAWLRSLTRAVNQLDRPVHPAALTRMIQAIQETQAALAQALARWQAEPC